MLSPGGLARSIFLTLYLCIQLPLQILADVCPKPEIASKYKQKRCPDFKDEPNRIFCCPSSIEIGSFYCCTQEDLEKFRALESAKAWKEFFRSYLAVIVLCSLFLLCALIFAISFICRRMRSCPLYRSGPELPRSAQAAASMYRPVDTAPPKIFEAPPPYEVAFPPPVEQGRNDWNCLLENELNVCRREAPVT